MSGKSLRAQVVDSVREKIALGAAGDPSGWPPGHQLPTKRELAIMYGVSTAVIDAAMIELRMAGLVRGQQGKAVYVAEGRAE